MLIAYIAAIFILKSDHEQGDRKNNLPTMICIQFALMYYLKFVPPMDAVSHATHMLWHSYNYVYRVVGTPQALL